MLYRALSRTQMLSWSARGSLVKDVIRSLVDESTGRREGVKTTTMCIKSK